MLVRGFTSSPLTRAATVREVMNAHPTQLDSRLGTVDWTHDSQEYVSELHDGAEMLKERLREAKSCAEEECRMKSLDGLLNTLLLCAGATAFINKFATLQPGFSLYHRRTTLVAGVNDVFRTISNGTFTNGTILSVFAAPSFTFFVLQGVMDACLFVPPFVVAITIFGKWVLGHFATGTSKDNDVQMRRRPLHDWPQHVRARVLSCPLYTMLALWAATAPGNLCYYGTGFVVFNGLNLRNAKLSSEGRLSPELYQELSSVSV
ncbi:uncharacterized protein BJ212DRAFT_1586687 [Suillus subaureus]|uniref:Uncharacterized protein n=1 Tax=Suillus subaureus TaxID=48587 RepID=A0A9P7JF56_9AGAM|nr:uncharacterized protein BJ212DRAFT_1586687 [Suillus subaureus]KAG1818988.1 hypothetical protein BJ212DRAFT_1586687 [Suillus subaureus]